jgi:small subunit ribosomal protein S20
LKNRIFRGSARTSVKKAREALSGSDAAAARQAILEAVSELDKAAEKGVLHKNNAARRKSRLMRRMASLEKKNA